MSTQKEESAKVEEPVVNQSANNAATTATKKRRRGISNETRTTARKKFSHKDAINNLWLFDWTSSCSCCLGNYEGR